MDERAAQEDERLVMTHGKFGSPICSSRDYFFPSTTDGRPIRYQHLNHGIVVVGSTHAEPTD